MIRAALAASVALAACLVGPAHAEGVLTTPATTVRVGTHPGYSRVVLDLPPDATAHVVTEGQRVLLVLGGAGTLVPPADLPRNVRAFRAGPDSATLDLVPGATARPVRIGDRLVIDVLDPGPLRPIPRSAVSKTPVARTVPASPTPAPAVPKPEPAAPPAQDAVMPPSPEPTRPAVPDLPPAPSLIPVRAVTLAAPAPAAPAPVPLPEPALLIRADADVGAAAFRRGGFGTVVLDRRLPEQRLPPGATWTQGAVSTVVQFPLPPEDSLRLSRTGAGWSVERVAGPGQGGLLPSPIENGVQFAMPRPGRRVAVRDPVSGATLLVGASLENAGGVADARRTPGYRMLASWLGVAVEPLSDQVDLQGSATGFTLTPDALLPVAPGHLLSRRFDLPDEAPAALVNRLRAQLAGAAAAAPRARARDRLAAVQSMIALGLGAEAQALAQLVAADDPQDAADAQTGALAATAAVLAGRAGEAGALDDPRLDGTDEIALWRGLRDRRLGSQTEAARRLGLFAPLALSYPAPLQHAIWPDLAEAAVEADVAVPPGTLTPFARAAQLDRAGKLDEALAAYDDLVSGQDRFDQVRAAARAAELRLAANRIGPAEASEIMERQGFAWRGDGREVGFRLRAAELRAAAQEWRPALEALRAIEATFPEQKAQVAARKAGVMGAMLTAQGAGLSALDLVLLAADYTDCVPDGPAGATMARLLADKLAALDLPARAVPVLQGLVRATAAGGARAEFGLRLGELLLEGGDALAAATALDASTAPDLPAPLRDRRELLQARVRAARGDPQGAAASLMQLGTEDADDLRATLLAKAGDWPGALGALNGLVARRVPADGPLSVADQELLVRQADAATQAKDAGTLRSLRQAAARLDGPRAEVFRLLTAAPLDTAADLPRARLELAAARGLSQRLGEAALGR